MIFNVKSNFLKCCQFSTSQVIRKTFRCYQLYYSAKLRKRVYSMNARALQ